MFIGQNSQYPRLLADIGGTHARFALEVAPGVWEHLTTYQAESRATLSAAIHDYLQACGQPQVVHAAMGVATAITGDAVCMTNHHWAFSISGLQRELGLQTLLVLNDFTMLAFSLPHLAANDVQQIGGDAAIVGAPVALLGPGTGLGVSGLIDTPQGWQPLAGEGGHIGYAPKNQEEMALWAFAYERYGHVSAERFLSGAGLSLIHEACQAQAGNRGVSLPAAEITRRALAGECTHCQATVDRFCAMLGSVASSLALTLGARGGVYIGGGIVPRLLPGFARSSFRQAFNDGGRMSSYLSTIPVWVITSAYPALLGAQVALDASLRGSSYA